MLIARDGERLRIGSALGWSSTWATGAAIGVGLGGWLTLVGGAGAPGTPALDPAQDLVALPLAAFGIVGFVHLLGQILAAILRGRAAQRSQRQDGEPGASDDDIGGQIERG